VGSMCGHGAPQRGSEVRHLGAFVEQLFVHGIARVLGLEPFVDLGLQDLRP
jgi:hypothetical protein